MPNLCDENSSDSELEVKIPRRRSKSGNKNSLRVDSPMNSDEEKVPVEKKKRLRKKRAFSNTENEPVHDPYNPNPVNEDAARYILRMEALLEEVGSPSVWKFSEDAKTVKRIPTKHDPKYNRWVDEMNNRRDSIYASFNVEDAIKWTADKPLPVMYDLDPPHYFNASAIYYFHLSCLEAGKYQNMKHLSAKSYTELLGGDVTAWESWRPRAVSCLSRTENLQAAEDILIKKIEEIIYHALLKSMKDNGTLETHSIRQEEKQR